MKSENTEKHLERSKKEARQKLNNVSL